MTRASGLPSRPHLAVAVGALLCCAAPALGQRVPPRIAVLDQAFRVDTTRGDRAVAQLTVLRPGRIRVQAMWSGSARSLALILNGPGQTGYYARRDGSSPLVVEFDVGQAHMRRGRDWKVSIVNFGGGTANGHLLIEYPGRQPVVLLPTGPRLAAEAAAPQSGEPVRTFLEDGTVETRYPDGTIRRQRVGSCGYTIIRPDGTRSIVQCEQVQREEIPDLPADLLAREDLGAVLDAVAANLLDDIKGAVRDEAAVNNYLRLEEGKNLQDRIFLRLEALSALAR